jgi:general stress protein 26
VAAIEAGATTTLLFQNDKEGDYLQLSGRAAVVDDRVRLEKLYTTLQRTWFPKGLDDPDITLVRFDADEASYWDSHDSYLRLAAAFAKSLITGEPGKSGNAGVARLEGE